MKGDYIGGKPLLKYLHYNFPIAVDTLGNLKIDGNKKFTRNDVKSLVEMSNAENRQILYKIGEAASAIILKSHFD